MRRNYHLAFPKGTLAQLWDVKRAGLHFCIKWAQMIQSKDISWYTRHSIGDCWNSSVNTTQCKHPIYLSGATSVPDSGNREQRGLEPYPSSITPTRAEVLAKGKCIWGTESCDTDAYSRLCHGNQKQDLASGRNRANLGSVKMTHHHTPFPNMYFFLQNV